VGLLPGLDDSLEILDLLERLLRLFRIVPEFRLCRLPLELLYLFLPGIDVKDTPEDWRCASPGLLPSPDQ
jgi:hypothetical protein